MRGYFIDKYITPDELKLQNNVPEPTAKGANDVIVEVYSR